MAEQQTMNEAFTSQFLDTPDGARLNYYTVGQGPGILIIHGAAGYALTHQELALQLKSTYTVHLVSRRCRGLSGEYPDSIFGDGVLREPVEKMLSDPTHMIQVGGKHIPETYHPTFKTSLLATEIADLETFIAATGAKYAIGVSSGALILLHALQNADSVPSLGQIRKFILFEPPLLCSNIPTSLDISGMRNYEKDLNVKGETSALVTAMHTVQLGPTWIPRKIMEGLTWVATMLADNAEKKRIASGGEDRGKCTLRDMGRVIRYDFAIVEGMVQESGQIEVMGGRGKDVILLQGDKTNPYLKESISVLRDAISDATFIKVEGAGHELLVNSDMRGQPVRGVPYIHQVFT